MSDQVAPTQDAAETSGQGAVAGNLTEREGVILSAAFRAAKGPIDVDYTKMATILGYTNKDSARNALTRITKKLETVSVADGDNETTVPVTPKKRARATKKKEETPGDDAGEEKKTPKRARKTPVKKEAQDGDNDAEGTPTQTPKKRGRPTKKEREARAAAEAEALAKADAESDGEIDDAEAGAETGGVEGDEPGYGAKQGTFGMIGEAAEELQF